MAAPKQTASRGTHMKRWAGKNWMWVVVAGTAAVYAPLAGRTGDDRAQARSLDTLTEILGLVEKQTVEPPTPRQLTNFTLQGMLHTLDPHSNYMDESEFRMMREDQRASFYGIGSVISQQADGIVVMSTVRGGPSEKLGIRPGDYIREIDGKNTEGWTNTQAVQKLRGEKGTVVEVAMQRAGYPDLVRFSITRGEIPTNSVYYAFMLDSDTGFILIKDFGEATSEEFERAVEKLKAQGMKRLLLDLRNNGGGVLDAAVGICRQLIGPGELIVTQKGREGRDVIETRAPKGSVMEPFPLVILVNRGTASASEIVTGAVQDHDRGLVVGTTSWGKGLVQSVLTIGRSRGLALTTGRYYTPSGRSIQRDYMHGLDDYYNPEEDAKIPVKPVGPPFKTDLGRTVYGGGGITPDYVVPAVLLKPFVGNLRFRTSAFFKFAVYEKEHFGVKQDLGADDIVLARFKTWALEQKIALTDKDWEENKEEMRVQISYEMQNLAYGLDSGFKFLCTKDPQVQKALSVMPEAAGLAQKKILVQKLAPTGTVARN